MENIVIVIPSLEPDTKLLDLLSSIRKRGHNWPIVIVDDGSGDGYQALFEAAEKEYDCEVLRHEMNKGKGAAIKTAIRHILSESKKAEYIVTIDSDGQHTPDDMIKCIQAAEVHENALVLGVRDFSQNIPLRSKFGNLLTRKVMRLMTGIDIKDTQTGLRVIPALFMERLLEIPGDRFEYETQMLLETKRNDWKIYSQEISTIYLDENASSHFRVIADSIAIYAVFFKYLLSSIAAFLLDVAVYALILRLLKAVSLYSIGVSSLGARGVSSLFNYFVNRNVVFSNTSGRSSFLKYFALVLIQILLSTNLVYFGHLLFPRFDTVPIKIMVDGLLFFFSYYIQKNFIFTR
ncbi:bifunctional glycosyltransferase family 2/GtrA family protein [uncultured Trichococcus sp.]|uniref:bifunctional glycosyltransferase family 2/GtrA family protein n=1 Tax=uncultured Trichococcus sp. TaxID=189665 RepID=UPI002A1877B7|nr:bifunctional glycosyltransferase family 2/GtrA family protein [uncultured Trichococcus sp.]